MTATARVEPHVLFPVFWPADSTPPDVAGWVCHCLKMHIVHAQAVAEIARRNGGGGHLRVELKPDTWGVTTDGSAYTGAIAEGRWTRDWLELSDNAANAVNGHGLRAAPTQTCFTAQVVVPNGGGTFAARLRCNRFHAAALRALEEQGMDETTAVVLAMDGGTT